MRHVAIILVGLVSVCGGQDGLVKACSSLAIMDLAQNKQTVMLIK